MTTTVSIRDLKDHLSRYVRRIRAGDMADAFALRAFDSVHLAAAEYVANGLDEPLTILCFDRKLSQAASVLRFRGPQTGPGRADQSATWIG